MALNSTDLDSITEDFVRELMRTYAIDADFTAARTALVPFLDACAPGEVGPELGSTVTRCECEPGYACTSAACVNNRY